uniref:Phospholipid scramblase n=1 Tax=Plectus sambesii TaxID=2011161 RepID=A0A914VNU3_9BILA
MATVQMRPLLQDSHNYEIVTMQPGVHSQQQWMSVPRAPASCPPGLEYLAMIDQLLCQQKVSLAEVFIGWESNNKYVVLNSVGQQIFYAFEDTDACSRMCCGNQREFTIHIVNNFNQEVMKIYRPFKCFAGCCWCATLDSCAHETFVEAPVGVPIGSVRQLSSGCTFDYAIKDAVGETQLIIDGPCMMCRCCADVEFPIFTKDKRTRVGCVTKQYSGLLKEMYSDADNFGITFPLDLDVKIKATLMGAMFLIDFMAFENSDKKGCLSLL